MFLGKLEFFPPEIFLISRNAAVSYKIKKSRVASDPKTTRDNFIPSIS